MHVIHCKLIDQIRSENDMNDEDDFVNLYDDFSFIFTTALNIKAKLADESDLLESVRNHYLAHGEYPDRVGNIVEDILKNRAPEYLKAFRGIFDNECAECGEALLNNIFFDAEAAADEEPEEVQEDESTDEIVIDGPVFVTHHNYMTHDLIWQEQKNNATSVASVLSVTEDTACLLLQRFNWNVELLLARFTEDPDGILKTIGLTCDQMGSELVLREPEDQIGERFCGVCFENRPSSCFLALPCGHHFCRECWKTYIEISIESRQHQITCQEANCHCNVVMRDVEKLCGTETMERYRHVIIENEIATNPNFMHCPNENCNNILTIHSVGLCNVSTCACGQRVCWKCREEAHAPLECSLLAKWRKIIDEDAMMAKWMTENTKPCPKCRTRIEKNGGCNHMTCRTSTGGGCGYEFCWICSHEWGTHTGDGYKCNKYVDFDEMLDKTGEPEAVNLKRMTHYHERYVNHKQSHETELKDRERLMVNLRKHLTDPKIHQVMYMTESDAESLVVKVARAIDTARSVLIWSYPHAFFMAPGSVELSLFEHVQTEVERFLELLTDIWENKPDAPPNEVKKHANLLEANTNLLNKHVDQYSH